jgi:hypothetical protein
VPYGARTVRGRLPNALWPRYVAAMSKWLSASLLAMAFVLSSFWMVDHFTRRMTHGLGAVAYIVVAVAATTLALRYFVPWVARRAVRWRTEALLAIGVLATLWLAFAILYPLANSGRFGGGTDRDEALNLGIGELFAGHYRYYVRTYFDMPLTPMPGALLLAAPFYALGNAAYQNMFWLPVFGLLLWSAARSLRAGLVLLVGLLLAAPEVARDYVTGGDLGTNTIYVLASMLLLLWSITGATVAAAPEATARRSAGRAHAAKRTLVRSLAAIGFGLALSSRPNWVLILPILLAALTTRAGWRRALLYLALSLGTAAAVTLPFYLYDLAGFSPLHVTEFVQRVNERFPHGSSLVFALGLAVSVVLGVRQYRLGREGAPVGSAHGNGGRTLRETERRAEGWMCIHCALAQAVPILLTTALLAIATGFDSWATRYVLAMSHVLVYPLLYAWTLCNRSAWLPDEIAPLAPASRTTRPVHA